MVHLRALEIREGSTPAMNLIMVSPHYFKDEIRALMNLINPQQTGYGARTTTVRAHANGIRAQFLHLC